MDYIRSLTKAYHCQFRRYKIYKSRRLDKAVAADKVYRVREIIGIGYVASGTVRKRLPEGSYLRGRIKIEIYV